MLQPAAACPRDPYTLLKNDETRAWRGFQVFRGVGRDRTGDTWIFSPQFIGFTWRDMSRKQLLARVLASGHFRVNRSKTENVVG